MIISNIVTAKHQITRSECSPYLDTYHIYLYTVLARIQISPDGSDHQFNVGSIDNSVDCKSLLLPLRIKSCKRERERSTTDIACGHTWSNRAAVCPDQSKQRTGLCQRSLPRNHSSVWSSGTGRTSRMG